MNEAYNIKKCKSCGQSHSFLITVEKEIPLFGGPAEPNPELNHEWAFTCPVTHKIFSEKIELPKGLKVVAVAPESAQSGSNVSFAAVRDDKEYYKWMEDSRSRALTFSTSMLTTSIGAIGVFFAIEKYLGSEKLILSGFHLLTIIPPVLYLTAALFFVFALRPKYKSVAASDFEKFRNDRLKSINYYSNLGTFIFLLSTTVAIIIFFISIT